MNSIHPTNSVSPTQVASEMVPTPVPSGGSADVFDDSSSDNTIDNDESVSFDINYIPKSPHSSIYGLRTSHGRLPDDDNSSINDDTSVDEDGDQYVAFDADRFSDGAYGSVYMKPPSPSPKNQKLV